MTWPPIQDAFSYLCPWLALLCLLQWIAGDRPFKRGPVRLVFLAVVAIGILQVPIKGFSLAQWVRGIEANFSIPLLALLVARVAGNEFSARLLDAKAHLAAWSFGAASAACLFPLALGLGDVDPYEWGWQFSPLFAVMAAVTAWLLWTRNRFGMVLLLAIVAYHLRLLESNNYWNYLVDPVYGVASVVALLGCLVRRVKRRPAQTETSAAG
jgi:hypothetical protein